MFQHGFVIIWGLNVALVMSAFFLVIVLYHRDKKSSQGFYSAYLFTILVANIQIFILAYVNINVGRGILPRWFFVMFFGGII